MAENTSEDDLLRDRDISVEENLDGIATGSKSLTVLSENAELLALLTSMNKTMKAMSESLRCSGETPTRNRQTLLNEVERPIMVPKIRSAIPQSRLLTSFLESNRRQKIQDGDEEEETLVDEVVQSMNENEKTCENLGETRENRREPLA